MRSLITSCILLTSLGPPLRAVRQFAEPVPDSLATGRDLPRFGSPRLHGIIPRVVDWDRVAGRATSRLPDSRTANLGVQVAAEGSHRVRNAVIGGLIGGAAGMVTCTVISNLVKDPGTGFSTCTTDGYLAFGLGGAGLGAVIGALIR